MLLFSFMSPHMALLLSSLRLRWYLSAGAGRGWRAKPNSTIVLSVVLRPNIHPSPYPAFYIHHLRAMISQPLPLVLSWWVLSLVSSFSLIPSVSQSEGFLITSSSLMATLLIFHYYYRPCNKYFKIYIFHTFLCQLQVQGVTCVLTNKPAIIGGKRKSSWFPNLEFPWTLSMEVLHRHDWLIHWPLVIDSTSRSSSFSGNQGVGLKVSPLYSWWVLPATSPHP